MIIYVDIDDTICYREDKSSLDYSKSIPYINRIQTINNLYEKDNTIIYWTARGTLTNINWFDITYKQLVLWKCKFHELRMGKPNYDLFIDDKNISSESFFNS